MTTSTSGFSEAPRGGAASAGLFALAILGWALLLATGLLQYGLLAWLWFFAVVLPVSPLAVVFGSAWLWRRAARDVDRDAVIGARTLLFVALACAAIASSVTLVHVDYRVEWGALGLAFLLGAASATRALRVPWHALLRPPRPFAPSLILAVLAALLLSPVLGLVGVWTEHLARVMANLPEWDGAPTIRQAARGGPRPSSGVLLSFFFPSIELLLHGALRRAFAGATTPRFAVATACAAALLASPPFTPPSGAMYAGFLVTGFLARRSESVVPGIAFWQALALSSLLWNAIVP